MPSSPPIQRPSSLSKYGWRLLVLGVVLGSLYAAYRYFGPSRLAPLVASRLEAALGGRVQIQEVVPGLESSSLKGVQLFEKDATDTQTPLLEMREVETDVSGLDAVKGIALPKLATVKGGQLLLRFDANNKLLTQLPKFQGREQAPRIELQDCKVILRQEGRPDFEVTDVQGDIHPDGANYRLKGTIDDPFWGKWDWDATFEPSPGRSVLNLHSAPRHITQAILEKVPFVPASVWKQVQFPEGDTPVDLTVTLTHGKKAASYRVVLAPKNTKLHISSIDLSAEQAEGKVEIADKVVKLADVRGQSTGGAIKAQGELDFRDSIYQLKFNVEGEQLELADLPKTWSRPDSIQGLLSGKADLDLRIVNGKVESKGSGRGILLPKVGLKPIPIPIRMYSDGKKFHFGLDLLPGLPKLPGTKASLEDLRRGVLLTTLPALQIQLPQRMIETKLQLKDADLEQLTKALGIKLTTPITGKISTDLVMQVPWNKVTDRSAYHVKGTVTASRLETPELTFEQVQARLEYANNVLKLDDLHGRLTTGGDVRGKVELRMQPMDKIDANVDLTLLGVSLKLVQKLVPELNVSLDGRLSGTVRGNVQTQSGQPVRFLGKVEGAAAPVWIEGFRTERWQGTIDFQQTASIYKLQGDVLGGKVNADVQMPIGQGEVRDSTIRLSRLYLGRLPRAIPNSGPIPIHGTLSGDVTFRPTGPRQELTGSGKLVIERFRADATQVGDTLQADIQVARNQIRIRDIAGRYAQGQLRGQIALGLTRIAPSWFSLTLEQAEAERLLASWPELSANVQGPIQVLLRGRIARESDGTGEISFSRLKAFNVEMLDGRLPFHWIYAPNNNRARVQFQESRAIVANGRLIGEGSITLGATTAVESKIRFQNVQLRPLVRSFTNSTQVSQGTMTGRLELRGDNVHSADDLTGTLDASLQQAQVFELPVFRQISGLVLPGQSSANFSTGVAKARLARGLVHIEKLGFNGSMGQVFVTGTIGLSGRLSLEVTANTSQFGLNTGSLVLLSRIVPASGPIPVPVLNQATALLGTRVLYLHVTGTVNNPVMRFEPLAILSQEALRFLVLGAILPAI